MESIKPNSPSVHTLADLEALTSELVNQVPVVKDSFPDFQTVLQEWETQHSLANAYVFGTIKSGKSTLVNSLLAADMLPRGSGVKTFNRTAVRNAVTKQATIRFFRPGQLLQNLIYDMRILGFDPIPEINQLDATTVSTLRASFQDYMKNAEEDGRYDNLVNPTGKQSLLGLSFSRLERVLTGLEYLFDNADLELRTSFTRETVLEFGDGSMDGLKDVLSIEELAPLIDQIILETPFPESLPAGLSIVDCQGSDSFNPLDFASVDQALHLSDGIVYVVNSRLGIRDADAELLAHLHSRRCSDQLLIYLNVEAHQPVSAKELDRLKQKLAGQIQKILRKDLPVVVGCAYFDLMQAANPAEAERITSVWREEGEEETITSILEGRDSVVRFLGEVADSQSSAEAAIPSLIARARNTATLLLNVDEENYGKFVIGSNPGSIAKNIDAALAAESANLQSWINRDCTEVFEPNGTVHKKVSEFLAAQKSAPQIPQSLLESSTSQHGKVIVEATSSFQSAWCVIEEDLQKQTIEPLVQKVRQSFLKYYGELHERLLAIIGNDLAAGVGPVAYDREKFLETVGSMFDHLCSQYSRPAILRPIVIPPIAINSLVAEFYTRKYLSVIKRKITKEDTGSSADFAKRTQKLWKKIFVQAVKAAREDSGFSISSCRENLKFQYFYKIQSQLAAELATIINSSIETYIASLQVSTSSTKALLAPKDRFVLEGYLQKLTTKQT